MQSVSSESEYTDTNNGSADDDDLLVSFPSRHRKRNETHRGSISSQSESSDTTRMSSSKGGDVASQADSQLKKSGSQQSRQIKQGGMFKSVNSSKQDISVKEGDGAIDVKSFISCSATSEETSVHHDRSATVLNKSSQLRNKDHSHSDSSVTSDEDRSTNSSSESETMESKQSQGQSEEVSTSRGIPYPTAAKSTDFYGWGEISESNYSQDGSYYRSSNAGSVKSNRALHVGFSDRNRCDVSLTESQASRSVIEEDLVEDEYDPKRPWKKRPVKLQLDEKSEKSVAISALSGSESGSVFLDNGYYKNKVKKLGDVNTSQEGSEERKGDANSETGKSVKSTRSSLNSDLSVLKVAKAALRKGSVSYSGVPRRSVYPRSRSIRSESDFTLTTQAQSYRKDEPFRPGPLKNTTLTRTLEILHNEAHKSLGIPNQKPPAKSKRRRFSCIGLMSDSCLPSIHELRDSSLNTDMTNKLQREVTQDSNQKHLLELGSIPFVGEVKSPQPVEAADYEREVSFHRVELRRLSAITVDDMNDDERTKMNIPVTNLFSSTEPGTDTMDLSLDSDKSIDTAEMRQIWNNSSLLARVEESEDEVMELGPSPQPEHFDLKQGSSEVPILEDSGHYLIEDGLGGPLVHEDSRMDLDLSVADSSDDEDESRPMARRNSIPRGLQQARNRFSNRRIKLSSRFTLCCRKTKQSCGRCSCLKQRTLLGLVTATTIIISLSLVMIFVYIIPREQGQNRKRPSKPNGNSQAPLRSESPSPQPTEVFTLWPTPADTYAQKYPQDS